MQLMKETEDYEDGGRGLSAATRLMDLSQGRQDPPLASPSSGDDARGSSRCFLVRRMAHSRRWLPGELPLRCRVVRMARSRQCSHLAGLAQQGTARSRPIPRSRKLISWCGAPTRHGHDSACAALQTGTLEAVAEPRIYSWVC